MRNILGDPTRCLNRNCRHEFYKESIIGYTPQSPSEVNVIVRCPRCQDIFALPQTPSMVQEYENNLINRPISDLPSITITDVNDLRRTLRTGNILSTIMDIPSVISRED